MIKKDLTTRYAELCNDECLQHSNYESNTFSEDVECLSSPQCLTIPNVFWYQNYLYKMAHLVPCCALNCESYAINYKIDIFSEKISH